MQRPRCETLITVLMQVDQTSSHALFILLSVVACICIVFASVVRSTSVFCSFVAVRKSFIFFSISAAIFYSFLLKNVATLLTPGAFLRTTTSRCRHLTNSRQLQ